MRRVCEQVARVAGTSVTVFITGESGTGKELVARTVHDMSRRRDKPFLAVNCGAISPHLIESEIFGHERGSFTGAERQRQGFFERAHGGTLFLDEITEMPPALQVRHYYQQALAEFSTSDMAHTLHYLIKLLDNMQSVDHAAPDEESLSQLP